MPEQNGYHFADAILEYILCKKNYVLLGISLDFFS